MRKLIWAVLILAALYAGYWLVGSTLAQRALVGWFDDRRAEGWTADYDVLRVQGFPSRFDVHVEGLDLEDPASGFGWQAPVVEFDALSYQPQHYIGVWPHDQTVRTPAGDIAIASDDMRASLVFRPGPSFTLGHMTLTTTNLTVTPPSGGDWGADHFTFATRRAPGAETAENAHRLGLDLRGFRPMAALRQRIDPQGSLPDTVSDVHLDATVGFDAPWDRHALEGGALPQPRSIRVDDLSMHWGDLGLTLAGQLTVDAQGVPTGELTVTADGWKQMLDLAFATDVLPANRRGLIEGGLVMAAGDPDHPDRLKAPVTFEGGQMRIGMIPLGPAPLIRLR